MTSSGTSTEQRQRRLFARIIAGGALLGGWIFVMWHHHFRISAPVVMLMLGWLAVLGSVYFLWRTADNADLDDHEDWWKPVGRIEELVREKKSLLKVIKEAELDRETGKLSRADADEIMVRYRARAIDVIKAIDEAGGATQDDVRAQIEREVRARLELDREKPDHKVEEAAAAPAAEAAPQADAEPVAVATAKKESA